jgi:hypothetical protein
MEAFEILCGPDVGKNRFLVARAMEAEIYA